MDGKTEKNKREKQYLILLLRATLRGESPALPPKELNWNMVYSCAERQTLAATVYECAVKAGCPEEVLARWKKSSAAALRKELLFDGARQEIFSVFDEEKIDYLPLKGIWIKNFYPHKGMRGFADNDILIREKDRRRVEEIMRRLGYDGKILNSVHDVYKKPPVYNFEFHNALFNAGYSFSRYFDGIWDRAVKSDGENRMWRMTDVDFYVYLLAHFKKHYDGSGTGLRSFVDLYLIRRNLIPERKEVISCLKATGLEEFERYVVRVTEALFGDGAAELDGETSAYIFSSGTYGTRGNFIGNRIAKEGRVGAFFKMAFPRFGVMKVLYPVLKYLPFLLPVFWIVRCFAILFDKKRRKNAKQTIKIFLKK